MSSSFNIRFTDTNRLLKRNRVSPPRGPGGDTLPSPSLRACLLRPTEELSNLSGSDENRLNSLFLAESAISSRDHSALNCHNKKTIGLARKHHGGFSCQISLERIHFLHNPNLISRRSVTPGLLARSRSTHGFDSGKARFKLRNPGSPERITEKT